MSLPVRVWCDGCFDMVHYGHANSFRQAKKLGDVLVVGVHNDKEITENKGAPLFTEQERYRMVKAIKWVDQIVEGSTYWPTADTLDQYNCDFAAHGDDISVTLDGKDPYQALKEAGRLKIFHRTEGVSTTDIISRMLLASHDHHASEDSLVSDKSALAKEFTKRSPWTKMSQFLLCSNKIVQFSEGQEPNPDDKIVYVSGGWDVFHPGHADFLEASRKEGDYLIVGIHPDNVLNEKHGSNYPIMNLYERTLSVLACRYVSEVVIGAPYDITADTMAQLKIDLVCDGGDTVVAERRTRDPYLEAKKSGKFKMIDTGNRLLTRDIVERVRKNRDIFVTRNDKKESREYENQNQ